MREASRLPRRAWPARLARAFLLLPLRGWPWLTLGLLLMALHLWAFPLAMRLALLPAASERGPGWMVARYNNSWLGGSPSRLDPEPPVGRLILEQPQTSLSAYTIVTAPHDGLYVLGLICDDYGAVWLDGEQAFELTAMIAAANRGEKTVSLTAGPHLVRVDLFNLIEKGNLTLSLDPFERGIGQPLAGDSLACPDLRNIATWWGFLETAPRLATPGMALISLGLVLLLLPVGWGRGALAWLAFCAVVVLPSLLMPGGEPPKAPFNDRGIIARLKAQQPEIVVIGNSIAESCNDPQRMQELLGGRRVANVITFGGFSAYDYLMLKNFVLASGARPKVALFFFRGQLLTMPKERTEGDFTEVVESLSLDSEPVLKHVLAGQNSLSDKGLAWVKEWLRVSGQHKEVRGSLAQAIRWLAIPPGSVEKAHKRRSQLQGEVNARFDLKRLRGSADDMAAQEKGRQEATYDFDALVEASFLPPILELCREAGIRPVFVRAQERPTADGPQPTPPGLVRYLERARAYLEAHGAGFHDFTGDPELPLSMYAVGDHIAYPDRFSELMLRRMPWAFQ